MDKGNRFTGMGCQGIISKLVNSPKDPCPALPRLASNGGKNSKPRGDVSRNRDRQILREADAQDARDSLGDVMGMGNVNLTGTRLRPRHFAA